MMKAGRSRRKQKRAAWKESTFRHSQGAKTWVRCCCSSQTLRSIAKPACSKLQMCSEAAFEPCALRERGRRPRQFALYILPTVTLANISFKVIDDFDIYAYVRAINVRERDQR